MSNIAISRDGKKRGRFQAKEDDDQNKMNKQLRRTAISWLLFDRDIDTYTESSADGSSNLLWAASETLKGGIPFEVSVCTQEPPGISHLKLKLPEALCVPEVAGPLGFPRPPGTLTLTMASCDCDAILLRAYCGAIEYFVLTCPGSGAGSVDEPSAAAPVLSHVPPMPPGLHLWRLGLCRRDDRSFVVAELDWTSRLHVLFLSSLTNVWKGKPARLSPEVHLRRWDTEKVLSCNGRLWFVDSRHGLISCDCDSLLRDDDQDLVLEFTLLPYKSIEDISEVLAWNSNCVTVSGGQLRYVEIYWPRRGECCRQCNSPGSITMWTLNHLDRTWTKDHILSLSDIWDDEMYRSKGLSRKAPLFPVVDPFHPHVVYLSVVEDVMHHAGYTISFDLRDKVVKSCSGYTNLKRDVMVARLT